MVGIGFTVMLNVDTGPEQPLAHGVTSTSVTAGISVVFCPGKLAMLPEPGEVNPILAPAVVQLKVSAGAGQPLKLTAGTAALAQTVMLFVGATVGVG